MPLIQDAHDSLPYIDAALTDSDRATATALIHAELDPAAPSSLHPAIPTAYTPSFSPALGAEHARLAAGAPKDPGAGIDLARYEALDAPPSTAAEAWRGALRTAYASSAFLSTRLTNLSLLEKFGKNAWLVSNSQLEAVLRHLEADLARARDEIEAVEAARRNAQAAVGPEMELLEGGWRTGVKRIIETETAAEALRLRILERKRVAAQQ